MAQRVNSNGRHRPSINIPFNWGTGGTVWQNGGGTNPFSIVSTDPNVNKFPQYQGTGVSGIDGTVTIGLTAGFTPPVTLTAWEWNSALTNGAGVAVGGWMKIGASATQYNEVFDATYASYTFQISENTTYLIQSSAAITGQATMDGNVVPIPGTQLEG
jgi:hypothetical protein